MTAACFIKTSLVKFYVARGVSLVSTPLSDCFNTNSPEIPLVRCSAPSADK